MSGRQNCHSVRTAALRRSQRARNVTSRFCPSRRNGQNKAPLCRRDAVHFEICGMRLAGFASLTNAVWRDSLQFRESQPRNSAAGLQQASLLPVPHSLHRGWSCGHLQ
jgi:hypothetical protein